jgi:hypothetical protein
MPKLKTIVLHIFDDTITLVLDDKGGGTICSTLRTATCANIFVDSLESLVLAHACAGVDVQAQAYVQGIEDAYTACANHCLG